MNDDDVPRTKSGTPDRRTVAGRQVAPPEYTFSWCSSCGGSVRAARHNAVDCATIKRLMDALIRVRAIANTVIYHQNPLAAAILETLDGEALP